MKTNSKFKIVIRWKLWIVLVFPIWVAYFSVPQTHASSPPVFVNRKSSTSDLYERPRLTIFEPAQESRSSHFMSSNLNTFFVIINLIKYELKSKRDGCRFIHPFAMVEPRAAVGRHRLQSSPVHCWRRFLDAERSSILLPPTFRLPG